MSASGIGTRPRERLKMGALPTDSSRQYLPGGLWADS